MRVPDLDDGGFVIEAAHSVSLSGFPFGVYSGVRLRYCFIQDAGVYKMQLNKMLFY